MNLFIKISKFSGGAPISMLEYAKLMNEEHKEINVLGEYSYSEEIFKKNKINTINISEFTTKKPFHNLLNIFKIRSILKKEKPNLLIMGTIQDCIYGTLLEYVVNTPILYVIPAGEIPAYIPKQIEEKPLIVFSEENKQVLLGYGIKDSNLVVIPNRFTFSMEEIIPIKKINNKEVNILLVSRLDKAKLKSIEYTIKLIRDLQLKLPDVSIKLEIAGDGEEKETINKLSIEINRQIGKDVIFLVGYLDNVIKYVNDNHIIIGKGRCIVDAMVHRRYAICVNEDDKFEICTEDAYDDLRKNNFSGRGIHKGSNIDELSKLIVSIANKQINEYQLIQLSERAQNDYSILKAKDQIIQMKNSAINRKSTANSITRFYIGFISLYCKIIKIKIQKRKLF